MLLGKPLIDGSCRRLIVRPLIDGEKEFQRLGRLGERKRGGYQRAPAGIIVGTLKECTGEGSKTTAMLRAFPKLANAGCL